MKPEEEVGYWDTFTNRLEDYENVLNSTGIISNNPELRYNIETDYEKYLDVEDPTFKAIYEASDAETRRELLDATSVSHAQKIAERRKIYTESAKQIQDDNIVTQFAIGAAAVIQDPMTIATLPIGGVATKAFRVGKAVDKMSRVARIAGAGAVTGALENVAVEAAMDAQGIQHSYMSAAFFGAAFGGGFGALAGVLSGPNGRQMANAMASKEYDRDFIREPLPQLKVEDGVLKLDTPSEADIAQMSSFGFNWGLDFFRSDINIMLQGASQTMRNMATKLSDATTSVMDTFGNIIPNKHTAMDEKKLGDGILGELINNNSMNFQAARDMGFKGNREAFEREVSEVYVKAARDQEMRAYRQAQTEAQKILDDLIVQNKQRKAAGKEELDIVSKIEATFRKELDKAYEQIQPKFNHSNPHMNKAAEEYRTYYNTMLERGKERKVSGLGEVSTHKLYRPRVYDYKKIKSMDKDEVYNRVYAALASHPNQSGFNSRDLEFSAKELTNQLIEGTFSLDHLTSSFVAPNKLPFDSILKHKKWKLDESKLGDIIKSNVYEVTGAYHYKMNGRQALAYVFGHDDIETIIKDFHKQLSDEGLVYTTRELQAFDRTVQDIAGTLRMNQLSDTPKWTFTRGLLSYNSLRLGGGFGGNQFIEAVAAATMNGISNIFNGRFGTTLKSTGKALYRGKGVTDDFSKALIHSGYLQDALHQHKANRYADTEAGFNSGWLENKLQGLSEGYMKWNGMRYFMGVMEDFTGGAIMEQIIKMSKKSSLSETEVRRLARWGLSPETARSLADDLNLHYKPKEGKLDLESFSEANRDRFQLAITKGIQEIVIQGDSIHLPGWMKAPGAATKMFTQFMRFPMLANNILLQRGLSEDKARLVSGAIASMLTYMGIKYAREEASVALGFTDPLDRKYDYFDRYNGSDNLMRALLESGNYTAQFGAFTTGINYAAVATGFPELGRDYTSTNQVDAFMGPTFGGLAVDILNITRDAAQGEMDDKTYRKMKTLLPFNNLPVLHEGLNALVEGGL
jgi:hypothetical protein